MSSRIYFPVEVVFRNLPSSEAVELKINQYLSKLALVFDHIMGCHVAIEARHRHQQGNIYHVSVVLKVPEKQLVVNRDPAEHQAHEDLYVAVRDAFNAIKKQLKTYIDLQRKNIKQHQHHFIGHITEIMPIADYGIIETTDGRSVRFSSSSVIDETFDRLNVGDQVKFAIVDSLDGPAASTVYVHG